MSGYSLQMDKSGEADSEFGYLGNHFCGTFCRFGYFISAVVTGYLVGAAVSGLGRGRDNQMKDRLAFNKVTKDL